MDLGETNRSDICLTTYHYDGEKLMRFVHQIPPGQINVSESLNILQLRQNTCSLNKLTFRLFITSISPHPLFLCLFPSLTPLPFSTFVSGHKQKLHLGHYAPALMMVNSVRVCVSDVNRPQVVPHKCTVISLRSVRR